MSAAALLTRCQTLDVRLWVEGDKLRYSAPRGALDEPLRAAILGCKPELIALLMALPIAEELRAEREAIMAVEREAVEKAREPAGVRLPLPYDRLIGPRRTAHGTLVWSNPAEPPLEAFTSAVRWVDPDAPPAPAKAPTPPPRRRAKPLDDQGRLPLAPAIGDSAPAGTAPEAPKAATESLATTPAGRAEAVAVVPEAAAPQAPENSVGTAPEAAGTVPGTVAEAAATVPEAATVAPKAAVVAELQADVVAQETDYRVDHADCLAWLASQPSDSIHVVFGSPPYEDARLYLEDGSDLSIARNTDEWVTWMVQVYEAALRRCTGLVAFVVDGRTRNYRWTVSPALLMAALHHKGITLRRPPIYYRVGIPGSGGPDWLRNDYEFIICATRGGPLPWSDSTAMGFPPVYEPGGAPSHRTQDGTRVNNRTYRPPQKANPGNVIHCKVGGGNMGDRLSHENEAPFPEFLAEFFVRSFCPTGGIVCDPFSGSGTTGAMAIRHGRRFVGCDVRQSQVELSRRRISATPRIVPTP